MGNVSGRCFGNRDKAGEDDKGREREREETGEQQQDTVRKKTCRRTQLKNEKMQGRWSEDKGGCKNARIPVEV